MSQRLADPGARARQRRRFAAASGIGLLAVGGAWVGRLPAVAIVPLMVVVLAVLDIISGVVAKGWAGNNSRWLLFTGCAMYLVMFWLYGVSLRFGELFTITIGWVVLVTVTNMALDRFLYRVHFPATKWLAAGFAVLLLAYLFTGTGDERT